MGRRCGLIIEDDRELGQAFAEVLDLSGIQVQLVRDGREALAALAETVPDIVLLDLHLPIVSGPELLHYIRNDDRLRATRVVVVSADLICANALRNQADLVLVKPVGFAEIFGLMQELFPTAS